MDPIATVILEGRSPDRIQNDIFPFFFKAIKHPFAKVFYLIYIFLQEKQIRGKKKEHKVKKRTNNLDELIRQEVQSGACDIVD